MRLNFLLFLLPLFTYANNVIEIPFDKVKQKVLVRVEKSRCSANGKTAYTLETVIPDIEYKLVCKLQPPIDQYDSATPVRLIQSFEYPSAILQDIESSPFSDLKKQGVRAITKNKKKWGTEYFWSTPTMGTAIYSYLCPKKSKHCFKIIHGGIEFLTFEVKVIK